MPEIRLTVRRISVGGGFKGAAPPNKGHLVCYQMTYLLGQHRLSAALSAVGATGQPVSGMNWLYIYKPL